MAAAIQCPNSLVAFFPTNIYRSVGSSAVLPELLRTVDKEKVSTVQFLRNGAVRLTYKTTADCDAAVSGGIRYGDVALRVVSVETKSRLVYLRDCPSEVPDGVVRAFFASFGEVHSVSRSCHDAFPGLFDGNRLVKMTLTKDIPASVRVAGFDCRVWYRRQPPSCSICKKLGHRGKSCPLDGLCRRCRQPGHVARECRNAWGAARVASAGPSSVPSTPAPPPAVSAPSPGVPSSDVPLVSGAVAAVSSSPDPVFPATDTSLSVLLPSTALASECEESDMEFVPAPVSDVPDSVSDEEMCSGDEEVIRDAAAAADTSSSVLLPSTALASECEESDMEFVPAPVSDVHSVSDEEVCSGDEEVIREAAAVAAAAAAADAADAPSSPRRSRRSRRSRRGRRSGLKYQAPPVPGVDISSVAMDLSPEDDPASSKYLPSFDEVWRDQMTWEELRSPRRHGRVLKKVGDGILSMESAPVLLFGGRSGVAAFPCTGECLDGGAPPKYDSYWSPSPYRARLPDSEDESTNGFVDFGYHTSNIMDRDIGVDCVRWRWYEDNLDDRPCVWFPTAASQLPPLPPDIPPSSFNVFVAWDSSE